MAETLITDTVTPGDMSRLSAEQKRALLSQLLLKEAAGNASQHPLSYGQRSLWYLHQMAPTSPAYTICYAGVIAGPLDAPALERAAQHLVDRHPILRTTYTLRDGEPVQLVHPRCTARIARAELGPDQYELDGWCRRESNRPFDLETGPVFRLTLLRRADDDHVLLMSVHHIAVDFWAIDVMLDELRMLYRPEPGGAPLPPAPRYVRYADEQRRLLEGPEGERLWRYWNRQLAGDVDDLRLPLDRPRGAVQSHRGAVHRFTLDSTLTAGLKEVGRRFGTTPFVTLLAAYTALLHRYSGQDAFFVGSPFACRDGADREGLVGYVANPVVLRADLAGDPAFPDLLRRTRTTVLEALSHQEFPFGLLVERLAPARSPGHSPLFQVSFVWEQQRRFRDWTTDTDPRTSVSGLDLRTLSIGQGGAPLDLMMLIGEIGDQFSAALQYDTDIFDESTIARMAGHFITLVEGIVADADRPVSELPVLTAAEQSQLDAWNDTSVSWDGPHCLHELIAESARRNPDAPAVSFGELTLTHAELDVRAEEFAHRLQPAGAGPDVIVPVLLERSVDLVVALLGVLKAGAAFMPLDPSLPPARLAAMISDARGAPVCVTADRHRALVAGFAGDVVCADTSTGSVPAGRVEAATTPDDLAYAIHTSGSTGRPKAALNTHRGICNRLRWMQQAYPLHDADRILHKTPVTFDAAVWEIFWPLTVGAQVVVAEPERHRDVPYLVQLIADESVSTVFFVPSVLRAVVAEAGLSRCADLRRVFCAGETLPYELAQRFTACSDAELVNEYGPSETAIGVTHFRCSPGAFGSPVPIGRPIANTRIHLLDRHGHPVPVGVAGELYIGGAAVGRGYLDRPEATAASFLADPFAERAGQRMYRTGDLCRYLPDGNIVFVGRVDDQVKVNGVRIEPGEVEAALLAHPAVEDSAVAATTDDRGNTLLVAHIVATGEMPTTSELRRFLLDRLPAAMVPAIFVQAGALPRTVSGKVDRRALAAAVVSGPAEPDHVAPRSAAETVLAEIWCEVLGLDRIGVHDDFFALGGSSTHSVEVSVRAKAAGLPLTPESVFLCGTIADLAAEYDTGTAEPVSVMPEPCNTVIESLGTYLPAQAVSTETVLADCETPIRIPLQRLTGIRNRRVAGRGEYSLDIARHAALDCLARSSYRPADIDVIIACNISRCDGPDHRFTCEPSTAVRLRDLCGLQRAFAFDITNACAGMWTGITVADSFLKTGLVRRALVVSGEYITHLMRTAQKEIEGAMDPRLACLTLGDGGAAVILERGPNTRVGFHDIDMATLGRYSGMCVAKATDRPHGGGVMNCDSIAGTAVAVKHSVPYLAAVMRRHEWGPDRCDHLIIHQTSETSLNDGVVAVNRLFGKTVAHAGNTICNLAERGNTSTTTHLIALNDNIQNNRIRSGDNVVFGITGSGVTVGAALYTLDDLPDRMRRPVDTQRRGAASGSRHVPPPPPVRIRIEGLGTAPADESTGSVRSAVLAAGACLQHSGIDRRELGLIVHVGVYRDECISEPAIAAFVAGELGVNDVIDTPEEPTTFAFDILNGAVGFLNACQVAAEMIATGKAGAHAMVVASEVETNGIDSGHPRYGLCETGTALMLGRSGGAEGFGRIVFRHHPEYGDALQVYTQHRDGHGWLQIDRGPKLVAHYLDCIPAAVEELLEFEGLDRADISAVIPPHLSSEDRVELAARLDIPLAKFVHSGQDLDPFTSTVPHGLIRAREDGMVRSGDVGLIIAAGSGLQIGCTTYRF